MRLLVLGASGLLGSNVVIEAIKENLAVIGTFHSESSELEIPLHHLDLRDERRCKKVIEETDPDVVVNCAAMTNVDACEHHPERAREINGKAPGKVASLCEARDIKFLHVSTDYVFGGEATIPYSVSESRNPIQIYGDSKLAGERAVLKSASRSIVIRPSFVYGVHRCRDSLEGFPAWVRSELLDGEEIELFTDQYVTPTRAGQASRVILRLLDDVESGVYHVASRSCVTPFEIGVELANRLDVPPSRVQRANLDDLERPAPRPVYSCLDVSKLETDLGRQQPSLYDDLDAIDEWITDV